tara:strand:- start:19464 stop:21656 length:2193 start_codon:yes stop_codon:yes gene_type:complete
MNAIVNTTVQASNEQVQQQVQQQVLSFVSNTVSRSLQVDDVNGEIANLIDEAKNAIGRFEATDEWLADNLKDLPVITQGSVYIMYQDNRGFNQVKEQSISESLWLIATKQLQYHMSVNYDLLSTAFTNWVNDNCYTRYEKLGRDEYERVVVTIDSMLPTAKDYLASMQVMGLISENLTRKIVRLQAGNNITAKVYEITPEYIDKLNVTIDGLREKTPMKCAPLKFQPEDWTDMSHGVGEHAGLKLVARAKVKNQQIAQPVLDAVNKLQAVQFMVSPAVLEAAKDMTMNKSLFKQREYKERFFSDKEVNEEAFDSYSDLLALAGKKFYFPVTLDTRGRMYYRGGALTPQGTDFCKAAFQFAEFKALGEHGFKATCLHVANVCGRDKDSLNNRIRWVQDNWELIIGTETHREVRKNFKGADVFQALVACVELKRLSKLTGDWKLRTSNLVCHQDGTCNGLQHMAALTGDRATAEAVNCVASTAEDQPSDVYGIVALGAEKHAVGIALELIKLHNRDMAKNPVMVTSYGATESTIKNNIVSYLTKKRADVTSADDIGDAYLQSISETAGAVTQLTDALSTRVQFAIAEGMKKFTWRTADGFLAATKYDDDEAMVVRVGTFHTRKRNMGTAPLDARKTAQAMAPNFVHSIDATHCRMVVVGCNHDLVTVHDSIGSHACTYFKTASMIREKFALVHNCYDALGDVCESMGQPIPEFPRKGDYNAREALESTYIFS